MDDHDDDYDYSEDADIPPHDGSSAEDDFNTPSWSWWFRHQEQFDKLIDDESARGAAILCRGYLEAALEELLLLRALNDFNARKQVGRALSFGLEEKIGTCGKLKLITEKTRAEADRIKQVGDRFAHRPTVTGAQDDVVKKLLEQMSGIAFFERTRELGFSERKTSVGILRLTLIDMLAQISDMVVKERERWRVQSEA
jgi:hypothetical protein